MRKAIPIGYEDFKEIITRDLYYVDKTPMIRELIESKSKVNLITRPRRFGKTLNLSMLRRFFEDERTYTGEKIDNCALFDGLAISRAEEKYHALQQHYPVINLSLKSAKQASYEMAYECLIDEIAEEYRRHRYVLGDGRIPEPERFQRVMNRAGSPAEYAKALEYLSRCLMEWHEENVIILIDEYDVPLENAYFCGFYDRMIGFVRSLFESALKTNPALEFSVITGCLRISKESIFTGLNNLKINTVLSSTYGDAFGFLQEEVDQMLEFYGLEDKKEEVRLWYDGYQFGKWEIYNPWSILNYVDDMAKGDALFPKPYWSNTSSNSIIRELVEGADSQAKTELEKLTAGQTIEKPVHEDITYDDIHRTMDNLWNFLFFTGYLKSCGSRMEGENTILSLSVPNREIKSIYRNTVMDWFDHKMKTTNREPLLRAFETGDCDAAADFISDLLMGTVSFFDYGENYYHGFLAGVLSGLDGYQVLSNRESGLGRPDLILHTRRIRKGRAMILELKVATRINAMEEKCIDALNQIKEKNYEAGILAEGFSTVDKYAICFCGKECMVMKAK